ncbi:hypothetical protein E2562_031867 [Oryza meyeriana var. granulata]|uniref:Ribosomal protein L30 N-terminal domain-containing protein n=1 Tax=Oryza meyeriana var. granulata TaxID=110450 RepID=A0A6G1CJX7_9ORYZ|nr:hypothetical protein E2562_031867 [Oryza meyeriana var. granulata]
MQGGGRKRGKPDGANGTSAAAGKRTRGDLQRSTASERALAEKKKAIESRKLIFTRAKQYAQDYDSQVCRSAINS